jgi:dephospho-CoA kinase
MALHRFNLALLVGEPASGKSTIAAILAANALDMEASDIVRIDRPRNSQSLES